MIVNAEGASEGHIEGDMMFCLGGECGDVQAAFTVVFLVCI
jgi:hypothetical protein